MNIHTFSNTTRRGRGRSGRGGRGGRSGGGRGGRGGRGCFEAFGGSAATLAGSVPPSNSAGEGPLAGASALPTFEESVALQQQRLSEQAALVAAEHAAEEARHCAAAVRERTVRPASAKRSRLQERTHAAQARPPSQRAPECAGSVSQPPAATTAPALRQLAPLPAAQRAQQQAAAEVIDLCSDDDDEPLPPRPAAAKPAATAARQAEAGAKPLAPPAAPARAPTFNPFCPDGAYVPREAARDLSLSTNETALVYDMGLVGHAARACLDTGNAGCTMITVAFARRIGLADAAGRLRQRVLRHTQVRGVVAGASESVPVITLHYAIKGKRLCVAAGLTHAALGIDLLVSRADIIEFERDGFRFSAR